MNENFADLIQNAVTLQRKETQAKADEKRKAEAAASAAIRELFRPVTAILQQAKEAYPQLCITHTPRVASSTGDDGTRVFRYTWPDFYYNGNGTYQISLENMAFVIRDKCYPSNVIVASYDHMEDLIPPLVTLVARVVTRRGYDKT